jgi:hypothetical protein
MAIAKPIALCLALSIIGCVHLELDREAGTVFPGQVMVEGQAVNLHSIYDKAGPRLDVEEDDVVGGGIASAPGTCITDAELDSFEKGHRDSSVEPACPLICDYQLYGVIVNRLYNSDGSYPCEPCTENGGLCIAGVMWTENRRAFAIFAQHPRIQADPGFLLLTAAHEAAHAYGVHHQDGNEDFDNPTLENHGDYFLLTNGNYEFSAQSRDHFANHPLPCTRPGVGNFWETDAEHAAWPGHGSWDPTCP